ncbi:MAG: PKD domain-containing protein [Chitinophagaceae bacterium]
MQAKIFAQVTADFSATPLSGCSPMVVQFTDLSTGGVNDWRWDLGNGVTSLLKNPSTTYFNPGTYTIKLTVRNTINGSVHETTKNQYITVYANPVVYFKASDSTGCFPLPVQFTDYSTPGSGTITNWSWDLGDGTTSTLQNPSHTYTSAGSFTVTLRVTNSFGCVKTFSKTQYIQTADGVVSDFTNNNPGSCTAPITINFINTSTGPGALTYQWDFGDGNTSTQQNPSHTYANPGSYTVTLVTVSPQGCSATMTKPNHISIGSISSEFTVPPIICQGSPANIINTTTPVPGSVLWDFGDGTTSTDINPVKTYTTSGTFNIKLENNFGGCTQSVTHSVVVNAKPTAAFTATQTNFCQVPAVANFTNTSTGAASYQWTFGDGGTSTVQNPSHTYNATGNYTVQLIVTSAAGCVDTLTRTEYIRVQRPTIAFNNLPMEGCIPLTIAPTATIVSNQPIAGYLWDFGDGGTSTVANPSHTYTVAGTYNVSLTITTTGGCTQTFTLTNAVRAGIKPVTHFSANPTDVCAMTNINFTDNSTGNPDRWLWEFGDGGTSTAQNPTYAYSDTGYFTVTLTIWSNGCPDKLIIPNMIHIRPPIARFIFNRDCADKLEIAFVDQSIGAETWTWNFGDGNTSTAQNPSHTFAGPGSYTVRLTVTNASCMHTTTQTVLIINEQANFTSDQTELCKGSTATFTPTGINGANINTWRWNFGDGTPLVSTAGPVSHTYTRSGVFTVTLTITDILGCTSVKTLPITVFGPTALFTSSLPAACLGESNIEFTDASTTDGTHGLVKWIWNYGDGTIDSTTPPPYSHFYTTAGEFDVSLKVVDNYGCSDIITKPAGIIIAQPHADFSSLDTLSCIGKPIVFTNASTGYDPQYNWTFGDGGISNVTNPTHFYGAVGIYSVHLFVTDRYGCKDSLKRENYINISYPSASFTVSDTLGICPPLLVNFTNTSTDFTSVLWNFGDGNTSTLNDPSHYYTQPGIYNAILTVTGPGGCTAADTIKIEVRGPSGTFSYAPLIGCNPLTVNFTAVTSNRVSFIWDYSDGNTFFTTDSVVSHTYTAPGEYIPKMIIIDASGCSVPIAGTDVIKVVGITASFTGDQFTFCDSGYIHLTNTSVSNDLITNYQWDFGDGNTSTEENPTHHYTTAGVYDITLTVTTQTGCTDTYVMPDTVEIYVSPIISILGDNGACVPAQLTFNGQINRGDSANLKWQWNFDNGSTDTLQHPLPQTFTSARLYNITAAVIDNNGCVANAVKTVDMHPLPNTNAGIDAVACRDVPLQLTATGAATYIWDPHPSLSCTDCAAPLAIPTDTITYAVTGISEFGCIKRDSVFVRVRQKFNVLVSPDDTLCVGGFVRLSASGADHYTWSPATGLDNPNIATPRATPTQTTTYTVTGTDDDNCFAVSKSVTIRVYPIPTVDAGKDTTISVGFSGQLHAVGSPDITKWTWTPAYYISCLDCPNPQVAPKQTTKYTVQVQNIGGCRNSDDVTVFVMCKNGNLFIPNTFSPNNDGVNDKFYPRGKGIALIKVFRVFDRWGEVLYERINFNPNDAAAGWDGMYKGEKVSSDVYIYTCDVVCENNEVLSFKGDVTVLR